MPKYITKLLDRLEHPKPSKPQYSPHKHLKKGKIQLTAAPDDTSLLN